MTDFWPLGPELIVFVQQYRNVFFDIFFKTITLMGEKEFYLFAASLFFWCFDFLIGMKLLCFVLISNYLNLSIKDFIEEPRPGFYDPQLQIYPEDGYSMPSNHAQTGLVYWLGLAILMQRKLLWYFSITVVFLMGFSRIYLGAHYPSDVFVGWLVGAILLKAFIWADGHNAFQKENTNRELFAALLLPALLYLVSPSKDFAVALGAMSGAWTGMFFFKKNIPTDILQPRVNFRKISKHASIGITGIIIFWLGLKLLLPKEDNYFYFAFCYIRYWLTAYWIVFGAPYLFKVTSPGHTGQTV
ncbi:MAG: phosphatase PAP2 family protein [Acidaminococcaceae bacterium]